MLGLEEWWEEAPATGVKCVYAGEVYSIGARVETLAGLKEHLKAAIPDLQSSDFQVTYTDSDGDLILITTDDSLLEAYKVTEGALRLYVARHAQSPAAEVVLDEVMDYGRLAASLSGVFVSCLERKAIGLGVVVAPQTGVCVCSSLQALSALSSAYALFSLPGFPHYFSPAQTQSAPCGLIFLRFQVSLGSEVKQVQLDTRPPSPGMKLLTMHRTMNNDPKGVMKWVEVKTVSGLTFDYDTKEKCGPNGSPLFTPDFHLFGLQLTDTVQHNTALSSLSILSSLPRCTSVIEIED